ncbi:MAG TPA: hypothetical protein VFN72_03990, partial [Solirubrobacterales bacterium]|nr:hypothetical protein [Solirubrobacterales bacterium]
MSQWKAGSEQVDIAGLTTSPDGRLVAVARNDEQRIDVVDVDAQVVVTSVRHPEGPPRLTFSRDGRSLWAANLRNASLLVRWELPGDPRVERRRGTIPGYSDMSEDGKRLLGRNVEGPGDLRIFDVERGEVGRVSTRVHDAPGLSPEGSVLVNGELESEDSWISLRELDSGKILARRRCPQCRRSVASRGGARLLSTSPFRVEVWDVMAGRVVFEDRARVPSLPDRYPAISANGRRIAWSRETTVWTRDLETGGESTLELESPVNASALDEAGQRLAICTAKGAELWDLRTLRLSWRTHSSGLNQCYPRFAADQRAIVLSLSQAGSVVLDARTGQTLISMLPSNDTNTAWTSSVMPDLRHQLLGDRETWSIVPLPDPDPLAPEAALTATLKRTGLRFEGTELVAAP